MKALSPKATAVRAISLLIDTTKLSFSYFQLKNKN